MSKYFDPITKEKTIDPSKFSRILHDFKYKTLQKVDLNNTQQKCMLVHQVGKLCKDDEDLLALFLKECPAEKFTTEAVETSLDDYNLRYKTIKKFKARKLCVKHESGQFSFKNVNHVMFLVTVDTHNKDALHLILDCMDIHGFDGHSWIFMESISMN